MYDSIYATKNVITLVCSKHSPVALHTSLIWPLMEKNTLLSFSHWLFSPTVAWLSCTSLPSVVSSPVGKNSANYCSSRQQHRARATLHEQCLFSCSVSAPYSHFVLSLLKAAAAAAPCAAPHKHRRRGDFCCVNEQERREDGVTVYDLFSLLQEVTKACGFCETWTEKADSILQLLPLPVSITLLSLSLRLTKIA